MTAILDELSATIPRFVAHGICAQADPESFFPEKGKRAPEAIRICLGCPVMSECAEYAITAPVNPHGIWGATTVLERKRIRTQRGIADVHPESRISKCGSAAGAKRHWRAGEPPCEPCRRAWRSDMAERRA